MKHNCDHADMCTMDPRCEHYTTCSLIFCPRCGDEYKYCHCDDDEEEE